MTATGPAQDAPLKLRARDAEDLRVVSALLQDALVAVRDMEQLPRERRFVMLVNRFRWEARAPLSELPERQEAPAPTPARPGDDAAFEDAPLYERVHCGVTFDRVARVQTLGIRRDSPARILNLLALTPDSEGLRLSFAEGGEIFLQGRRIVCHLEDLGEPWPTRWRPRHAAAETADPDEAPDGPNGGPPESPARRSEEP